MSDTKKEWTVTSFTEFADIFETWNRIDKYIINVYMLKTPRHHRPNLYILLCKSFTIQITVTHDAWGEYSTYIVQKNIDDSKPDHLIKKQEKAPAGEMRDFIKKYLVEYYYTLDDKSAKYKKLRDEYEAKCREGKRYLKKMKKYMKGISND